MLPGETLWSIAAANNFTTDSLAAYNGLSADAQVYTGETIQVPTASEAAGAASSGSSADSTSSTTTSSTTGAAHTVQPGESLSSVAAANGISPATLAADNGLSSDALLITGERITVPTAASSTASTAATSTIASESASSPPPESHPSWTSPIYCPSCPNGEAYLASNAAYNWNAMRQASLDTYGIDLYPAGPFSGYRSYAQQLYLYDLYVSGAGPLAAVPGTLVARVRIRGGPRRPVHADRHRPDRRDVRLGEDRGLQRVVARGLRGAVGPAWPRCGTFNRQ